MSNWIIYTGALLLLPIFTVVVVALAKVIKECLTDLYESILTFKYKEKEEKCAIIIVWLTCIGLIFILVGTIADGEGLL